MYGLVKSTHLRKKSIYSGLRMFAEEKNNMYNMLSTCRSLVNGKNKNMAYNLN